MSMVNSCLRLLTLLLILHWCVVDASEDFEVFQTSDFNNILDSQEANSGDVVPSVSYRYSVWNRCTKGFLRIQKPGRKGIDARGDYRGNYTTIIIESVGQNGLVRIKGQRSGLYLCFSRLSRLRAKQRYTPSLCRFKHTVHRNGHDEFTLAVNNKWYVGFRKKRKRSQKGFGKPLLGYIYRKRKMRKCYQFLITSHDPRPKSPHFPVDWDGSKIKEWDPEGEWIRRTEKHTRPWKKKQPKHRHEHGTKRRRRKHRKSVNR